MALADTIAELRSQIMELQMDGSPACLALAGDLNAVLATHTGGAPRPAGGPPATPAEPVVVMTPVGVPAPPVAHLDDEDDYPAGIDLGEDYLGGVFDALPEPNRLVVNYSKHDAGAGPLTEQELQAVLADAQAALELMGLGTIVVVDTTPAVGDPNATTVMYEVLEPGELPMTAIPMGAGAGVVAGVGRVKALTSTAYVAPAAAA